MRSFPRHLFFISSAALLASCAIDHVSSPSLSSKVATDAAPAAVATHLVIDEIMADPSKVADNLGEWFELYNPTSNSIDLSGWKITSANDNTPYVFNTSIVIPAGGYLACVRNPDPATNGGITTACSYNNPNATSATTINLNNSNTDYLAIKNPDGETVDSVFWGGTTPPTGKSRAVVDPSADHSTMDGPTATNWVTSGTAYGLGDFGTPGAANDGGTPPQQGGPVTSVTVSPSSQTISIGASFKFTASAKDANNITVATTYTWTSSNTNVATVDANGNATSVGTGQTTITAKSANNVTGTATLNVVASTAVYRNNVEFGTPTDADASDDYIIARPQYTLSYNKNHGGPNWVSWELNATQFGSSGRCDCFSPDPLLPDNYYHVVTSDYTGSGYDRGHMTPSDERTSTPSDNAVTFYLTNVVPQWHNLNAGPWEDLELYNKTVAQNQGKEQYIISGPIFTGTPATIKNEGKIAIPTSTWKIDVILNSGIGLADVHSTNDIQVIAVNMPNVSTINPSDPWQNYTTTVNALEAATGYHFLTNLPDSIARIVKANDHAPTTTLTSGATTVTAGTAFNAVGKFGDVDGRGDAPWTVTFNWGDGTTTKLTQLALPTDATQFARSHVYSTPGTYTVKFTVTDKLGAGGSSTLTVTVQ